MNKWHLAPVAIILFFGINVIYDEYYVDPNALVWRVNEELDGKIYGVIRQTDHGLAIIVSSNGGASNRIAGSDITLNTMKIQIIKIYPLLNLVTYRILENE